eukprot:TRINITY_DN42695_c0_g1_i1.p1 TRINITY_DN42695_c0_g1~~TRINITY_DN42695_c0_g1_i1.p1  ORF type:complete len:344 (+),score=69.83 TRINITY_DN42695_c0_g1_i1:71-1033(+)
MAGQLTPGERNEGLGDVQFRLLEWDRGPEFWGGVEKFSEETPARHWFCVRVVRRSDERPQRIENYDVTVSIEGYDATEVMVDKDEGWCHHNFAFAARRGLQLIVVRSAGQVVVERVVLFRPDEERLTWSSKGPSADGLPPKELAAAHLAHGQKKKKYGDLMKFRKWAAEGTWEYFGPSHSHYDWWMFPIHNRASKPEFAVGTGEVSELQSMPDFMANYREGVYLMLLSWGWDLEAGTWCTRPAPTQGWRNWSVRLGKVALSLATFHEMRLFNGVRDFLVALLAEEAAGKPCLTEDGHKRLGERTIVEEQFGLHPRTVLLA